MVKWNRLALQNCTCAVSVVFLSYSVTFVSISCIRWIELCFSYLSTLWLLSAGRPARVQLGSTVSRRLVANRLSWVEFVAVGWSGTIFTTVTIRKASIYSYTMGCTDDAGYRQGYWMGNFNIMLMAMLPIRLLKMLLARLLDDLTGYWPRCWRRYWATDADFWPSLTMYALSEKLADCKN